MLLHALEWISAIAAIAAAILWFWASLVRTPRELRHLIHMPMSGPIQGDLAAANGVRNQSRLNSLAAICAGVAALS